MAQVEIQAGPHRFVSLLSREAADELALDPGMLAVAAVKATNVSIEIPKRSARSRSRLRHTGGASTDPLSSLLLLTSTIASRCQVPPGLSSCPR